MNFSDFHISYQSTYYHDVAKQHEYVIYLTHNKPIFSSRDMRHMNDSMLSLSKWCCEFLHGEFYLRLRSVALKREFYIAVYSARDFKYIKKQFRTKIK